MQVAIAPAAQRDVPVSWCALKRAIDVVLGLALLLLAAPVVLLAAIGIVFTTGGAPFYAQERVGMHGRRFKMFKLRTMVNGAHAMRDDLMHLNEVDGPVFKIRNDPRTHPLGRFLRRTSIDELPQLINVVRGDMSIVGPRPEQLDLVERYAPEHQFRLQVKPGITGPMQVYGRGELTFDERLAVEREYVENLSLARDIRIVLMTLPAVFGKRGAY